jgi:O-acetyl-ADP-ribose deacetylase (regulator of RNase III)
MACEKLEGCDPGEVRLTPGYQLRAGFVIHTVAPTWMDGAHGELEALAACYTQSLELARTRGFRTLAFPSLGSGRQPQIPLEVAAPIAIRSILAFLETSPMPEKVFLVCFDTTTYQAYQKVLREALP